MLMSAALLVREKQRHVGERPAYMLEWTRSSRCPLDMSTYITLTTPTSSNLRSPQTLSAIRPCRGVPSHPAIHTSMSVVGEEMGSADRKLAPRQPFTQDGYDHPLPSGEAAFPGCVCIRLLESVSSPWSVWAACSLACISGRLHVIFFFS